MELRTWGSKSKGIDFYCIVFSSLAEAAEMMEVLRELKRNTITELEPKEPGIDTNIKPKETQLISEVKPTHWQYCRRLIVLKVDKLVRTY